MAAATFPGDPEAKTGYAAYVIALIVVVIVTGMAVALWRERQRTNRDMSLVQGQLMALRTEAAQTNSMAAAARRSVASLTAAPRAKAVALPKDQPERDLEPLDDLKKND